MIHTILQIIVFQLLFLAAYELFLKNETFFNLNRAYLLITPIISIVLPFISIGFIQENLPQGYLIQLPAVFLGETSEVGNSAAFWVLTLKNVWILGIVLSAIFLISKILRILKLKISGTTENIYGSRLTILPKTDAAFSFFDTIYLGENISEENKDKIIAHERVHIQQRHSIDLVYFELLRIIFWFNPLIYMFQNRIATLHEYIADAEVTREKDKKQYYQNLLSEVFQTQEISFINTFFNQSLIKKRIIMLQKSKSQKIRLIKYLMMLPLIGGILIYTSCSDTVENSQTNKQGSSEMPLPPPPPPPPPVYEIPDFSYADIEKVPTYPGCSGDNEAMKKCMSIKISEFVNQNFNTGIADDLKLSGLQRISVQFKIDKTGNIVDVKAKAPKPELEAEAVRVVEMLPHMTPGEQDGEKVGVLYTLPIVFDVK